MVTVLFLQNLCYVRQKFPDTARQVISIEKPGGMQKQRAPHLHIRTSGAHPPINDSCKGNIAPSIAFHYRPTPPIPATFDKLHNPEANKHA